MKRIVRASFDIDHEYRSGGIKRKIAGMKKDLKTLLGCETLEDVNQAEWEYFNISYFIQNAMKKGKSFEDALEFETDSIISMLSRLKSDYAEALEYEANAVDTFNHLFRELQKDYHVAEASEDTLIIDPGPDAKRSDLVAFVDKVVEITNGKYWGTGRGGSWTTWDILAEDNTQLKAGVCYDDRSKWEVTLEG